MVRMALTRRSSQLTIQSFGDISRFLREGVATRSRARCATAWSCWRRRWIRRCVRAVRASDAVDITRHAAALVQAVRAHQLFLTGLGSAWHSLYEFGAYQNALRELRCAVESGTRRWCSAVRTKGPDSTGWSCWPGAHWAKACCSSICMRAGRTGAQRATAA